MAVAFDAATTSGATSFTHTCGSGTDRLLVVFVAEWLGADTTECTAITYNGVALTKRTHAYNTGLLSMWYLLNPDTGANTVAITTTSSDEPACAITLEGVDQSSPFGTPVLDIATNASVSSTVNGGTVNDLVLDGLAALSSSTNTPGGGQTSRGDLQLGGNAHVAVSTAPGASSVGMTWTITTDDRHAQIAVLVKATAVPLYTEGSGFTLPNRGTALEPALEEWTETDHRIKFVAGRGDGVVTGCQVSAPTSGFFVIVEAGQIRVTATIATLAVVAVIPSPADASLPRIDVLVAHILSSGAAHVYLVTGTPSVHPRPEPLPVDTIGLAFVWVGPGFTSITSDCVVDKRCLIVIPRAVLSTDLAGTTVVGAGSTLANFTLVPMAGTIRNFYFRTSTSQGGVDAMAVTVQINGVDTALTATVGTGVAAGTFSDTTNSATVVAGDHLTLTLNNGGGTSAAVQEVVVELDPA